MRETAVKTRRRNKMFKRRQKAAAERREAEQADVFEKVKEIITELINV